MSHLWTIHLLGRLAAQQQDRTLTRFQTRQTGALLAYLAFYHKRAHPREVLAEVCWPEDEPELARRKLRVALASLRRQLEPPGVSSGSVIVATRTEVQLNPATCATDVAAFEAELQAAARAGSPMERTQHLEAAAEGFGGELLPGCFEEWVVPERLRLEHAYLQALCQLIRHLEASGDPVRALFWARRAVAADPLQEAARHDLMRLLVEVGQPEAALREYRELERLLTAELGAVPEARTRSLARELELQGSSESRGGLTGRLGGEVATARPSRLNGAAPGPNAPATDPPLAHPEGTVTLLFTEIEESTALRARGGDAVTSVLDAHAALLRAAFEQHGGVVIGQTADAFRVAFGRAGDAAAAAVAAQQALAAHPWPATVGGLRVRMGLHSGDREPHREALDGSLLHHTTRLTLAAHGGQTLLSEVAASLVRPGLAPGVDLVELGRFRLEVSATPERLFQLRWPGMDPTATARPNAAPACQSRLPQPLTRFFGRETEIARLLTMLGGPRPARLVTLTGAAGSGKTRLALAVAGRLQNPLEGAVWFVPLVDVTRAEHIIEAILDGMRLPRSPQLDPWEQVVEALTHQPGLLVLDNFEHLVEDGAPLVLELLEQVPGLSCLVTSRRCLDLPGECEQPLLPLPVPAGTGDPVRLLEAPSAQLFVDRAQAVRPGFQVGKVNAEAVAGICARLEGLPLAIELAAARIAVFTPAQLLARLSQSFELLTRRGQSADPRHQSLQSALEWSYQLLSPALQQLFSALSVFRGGWTLAAAEAISGDHHVIDHLPQLRQCSLVEAEESSSELRFRMLESVREYAAERLNSEERLALGRRHAGYYTALAEQAEPELNGPRQAEWLDRLEREHENLRAALDWVEQAGAECGEPEATELGLRLGTALWWFWTVRGYYQEGGARLERLLALPGARGRTAVRARALNAAARLLRTERRPHYVEEALSIQRELGDREGMTGTLNSLGWIACGRGDYLHAEAYFQECLAMHEALGNRWGAAMARANRGNAAYCRGDYQAACSLLETSRGEMEALGDSWHVTYCLMHLGNAAFLEGQHERAGRHYREALAVCQSSVTAMLLLPCLEGLAGVAAAQGDLEHAARLLGAVEPHREALEYYPPEPGEEGYRFYPARGLAERSRRECPTAWEVGTTARLEQVVSEVLDKGGCIPSREVR